MPLKSVRPCRPQHAASSMKKFAKSIARPLRAQNFASHIGRDSRACRGFALPVSHPPCRARLWQMNVPAHSVFQPRFPSARELLGHTERKHAHAEFRHGIRLREPEPFRPPGLRNGCRPQSGKARPPRRFDLVRGVHGMVPGKPRMRLRGSSPRESQHSHRPRAARQRDSLADSAGWHRR